MALLQRSQVTCKEFSIRHANTGGDQEYRLSQIVDNPKILSVSLLEVWHYLLLLFYCVSVVPCGSQDVPHLGTEPMPTALGVRSLNHWATREVLLVVMT